MIKLKMIGGNILIKPPSKIPPGSRDILCGEVLAVGPGDIFHNDTEYPPRTIPIKAKVGDLILYPKYHTDEVKINEDKYHIITEDAIVAIVEQGD